jgi:peptidoglycan/LPS O-acetylase OafA/YrhL
MRDIPSLTGLRGVAAVWVMMFHVSLSAPLIGAPWLSRIGVMPAGWVGVDLFFVLSGFILMWVHGADFARPTAGVIGRFAAARIVRVYPLSLAVLGLIVLLAWADPAFVAWYRTLNPDNFSMAALLRTALLATRWVGAGGGDWNQPVWSLSAELVGYAAFPVLAWFIVARSAPAAIATAAACLTALALFQIATGTAGVNAIDQIPVLVRMGCSFTAGMAVCRVRQLAPERAARWAGTATILACIAIGLGCHFKYGRMLAPAGFALLIFCLSFRVGEIDRLLSSRPALFLGRISFPLYLVHVTPLLWLVSRYRLAHLGPVAGAGLILAYIAGCLALAALLHRFVERPSHGWIKRWLTPASQPRARLSAAEPPPIQAQG